jgi:phospholipase C
MRYHAAFAAAAIAILAACAGSTSPSHDSGLIPASSRSPQGTVSPGFKVGRFSKIQHVVIVIQENRTVDNLFQFLPGANTQSYGLNSLGQTVPLQPIDMTAHYDIGHVHGNWTSEYNNGGMNGFDLDDCRLDCPQNPEYGYVPQDEVQPYYTLAETYAFADNFFQTNEGPSFPAHQYLISGTSALNDHTTDRASNNSEAPEDAPSGGCDSPDGSKVRVITMADHDNKFTFPCFHRTALMNELDTAGLPWKYYQAKAGPGLWNAVDAIYSIWSNPGEMAANVITPSAQFLTDVGNGNLAAVTWVTPTARASDHSGVTDGSGPAWVASVVNAIGQSPYWSSTAIFVTWDDWGGWYDHVQPQRFNSYELGFRVPLLVISPYAKPGYISHKQHEFGSILKFTEQTFGLSTMGTTDARADDLSDCFDFGKAPTVFTRIRAKYGPRFFARQPSTEPVDD